MSTTGIRESLLAPGGASTVGGGGDTSGPRRSEVGMTTPRASFTESLKSGFGALKGAATGNLSGPNDDSSGDEVSSNLGSESAFGGSTLGTTQGHGRAGKLHNKYSTTAPDALIRNRSNISFEGYVTMRKGGQPVAASAAAGLNNTANSSNSHFTKGFFSHMSGSQWARVYLVLCYTASKEVLLVYYNAKHDYERNPGRPLKQRPIDVTDYVLSVHGSSAGAGHSTGKSSSPPPPASSGSDAVPYGFSLVPTTDVARLKTCDFRCDTSDELGGWVGVLSKIVTVAPGTKLSGTHGRKG